MSAIFDFPPQDLQDPKVAAEDFFTDDPPEEGPDKIQARWIATLTFLCLWLLSGLAFAWVTLPLVAQ